MAARPTDSGSRHAPGRGHRRGARDVDHRGGTRFVPPDGDLPECGRIGKNPVTVPEEDPSFDGPGGGTLLHIRLALSFLTVLPVAIESASESDVAASMAWFPLVGLAMGILFALEDRALAFLLGHAVRSAIIVLSMAVLSGAIHLDGLADTADALGAGGDRIRALEVLRDSRIGTFGAIALFFDLGLKVLVLAGLSGRPRLTGLILAPMLGRW